MIHQQSHFFQGTQSTLYGELFLPAENSTKGYVICAPFAEEKKSAQRALVDLAKKMCLHSHPTLMFDYSGCGDSSGSFSTAKLSLWIKDIESAILFLKSKTGVKKIGLVGLRLGAYIMLQAEAELFDECILLEPVINPQKYFRQILRQKLVKELVTHGGINTNRNQLIQDLNNAKNIDFDGYDISPIFYQDFKNYSGLTETILLLNKPTLLLHINHSGRINKEMGDLIPVFEQNQSIHFKNIKLHPFWERIDYIDYTIIIQTVINFCC